MAVIECHALLFSIVYAREKTNISWKGFPRTAEERERGSSDKFLLPGVHDLAVDMCEMYGGEILKMRDPQCSVFEVPLNEAQWQLKDSDSVYRGVVY